MRPSALRLLQAQAVANGPHLAAEIKRNIAVFRAQHAVDVNLEGPDTLYVFGADGAAQLLMAKAPGRWDRMRRITMEWLQRRPAPAS